MGKKQTKPLLTISLLTSDRKETIRKCLDSLQPLRDAVDSELVIVDTGCDEEMLGIIGEYTDRIVHFPWCDDFAAARNAGLKKARGAWFMYIDDDEWFEDVLPIAEFFLSGEYQNYSAARYRVHNYMDFSGTRYTASSATRLFLLGEGVHFHGCVHEMSVILAGETKLLDCFVHHYGYVFSERSSENRHIKRNVVLLEKMLKEEPEQPRWWGQLAQEYAGSGDNHKFYEVCRDGIGRFRAISDPQTDLQRGVFYNGALLAKLRLFDYQEAARIYEKAVTDTRNNSMCRLALYANGATVYYYLEDDARCEQCAGAYVKLYEKLADDADRQLLEGAFFTMNACRRDTRDVVYSLLIRCGIRRGDFEALHTYFDALAWKEKIVYFYSDQFVGDVIHAMAEQPYESYFVHIAQTLMNRENLLDNTMGVLNEIEQNAKREDVEAEEQFARIIRIFSQVSSKHYYIDYLRVLNVRLGGDSKRLPEYFEALFDKVLDIFQLDDRAWEVARQYRVELEPLFLKIPFDSWKDGVVWFCGNSTLEVIQKRIGLVKAMQHSENIRYSFFYIKTLEARLMLGEAKEDRDALRELLSDFTVQTLAFYHNYYKQQAFKGDMDMLPVACRVAVHLEAALASEESGDDRLALTNYKKCAGVCPSLDPAISAYAHLYADEARRSLQDSSRAALELQLMAEQVLRQVPILLEAGKKEEALQTVQQLRALLPEDKRIQQLEEQIQLGGR